MFPQLAYPAGDVLDDILAMLDELSWSLPRFCAYGEILPINKALQSALIDVYTEMICFFARTIGFLRRTTHRMRSFYNFRFGPRFVNAYKVH